MASLFALVIGGFWVSLISQIGISAFVNTLGATLAPLYGIMIVDYYWQKKQQLHVNDLYSTDPDAAYSYTNGWNKSALYAFFIGAVFSVATVWIEELQFLTGYAWLFGAVLGGLAYKVLSPAPATSGTQSRAEEVSVNS